MLLQFQNLVFSFLNVIQNLFLTAYSSLIYSLLVKSAKCHKMLLPVRTCNACILNRIPAMNHHVISYINSNMARSRRIISSLEKDQIARLCIRWRYIGTIRTKSVRCCSSHVPSISTIIDYPAYKTRAVKTGRWRCTVPDIRITKIFSASGSASGKAVKALPAKTGG